MNVQEPTYITYYRGRVALAAILKALGIGVGDRVAIQAFTCLAVPEGVLATGALPEYVDIQTDGYCMDPDSLEACCDNVMKAIVVQHTFGIPSQMGRIMAIAESRGIPVIEDCCHTLEGEFHGKRLGSFGAGSFYSFEWGKPIVAGIGGGAVINEPSLREALMADSERFKKPSLSRQAKMELQYLAFGALYRPALFWPVRSAFHLASRLGAAEGNFHVVDSAEPSEEFFLRMAPRAQKRLERKLSGIAAHTQHAIQIADAYRSIIPATYVDHPRLLDDTKTVFARYPLRLNNKPSVLREARKCNIELAEWYATPIHPIPADQGQAINYLRGQCPNAEKRAAEVVSLPTHRRVTRSFVRRVGAFFETLADRTDLSRRDTGDDL